MFDGKWEKAGKREVRCSSYFTYYIVRNHRKMTLK